MGVLDLLRALQLALFVVLAVVAVVLWVRRRTRPAAYLAAAFGVLGAVLMIARLLPDLAGLLGRVETVCAVTGLLAFPWLLTAMVWSFDGRLPTWLRGALGIVLATGVAAFAIDIAPDAPGALEVSYLVVYVSIWTGLAVAAVVKLWREGSRELAVGARMRLMATGLLLLNLALLLAVTTPGADLAWIPVATASTSILAAAAFVAGFAPPPLLRVWWRRRSARQFQRMQEALIGAATPTEVAGAVVPMLAELVGGEVSVIARDGEVIAATDLDDQRLAQDRTRLLCGEPLEGDAQVAPIIGHWLVVRTTPYTPVFGRGEQHLVEALAIQLQLALERAELFEAHLAARTAAEAASQELEATLMGLSHDLKSPTVAVAGFAEMLEHTSDPDEVGRLAEQIRISTRYLEDLVDALLEFSKVGRTQLEVEPVDLGRTIASVARRVGASAPSASIVLDGEPPVVLVNPLRAEQVFDNLIGNALKHGGREDLTVTISTRHTSDGVVMHVKDDGRGIGDEGERIFALFTRGGDAEVGGSGVGLGMVRRIVESYGGTVRARPSAHGAAFEVWMPAAVVVRRARSLDHDPDGSVAVRPAR